MAIPNNEYIPTEKEKQELAKRLTNTMNKHGHDIKCVQSYTNLSNSPVVNAVSGQGYKFLASSTIKALNNYLKEYEDNYNEIKQEVNESFTFPFKVKEEYLEVHLSVDGKISNKQINEVYEICTKLTSMGMNVGVDIVKEKDNAKATN